MFGFCYLFIVGSSDRYKQSSCSKRSHSILEHNDVKYRVFSFLRGSEISTKSMLPATCSMQEKGTHALFIVSLTIRLSPFFVPRILNNLPASNISIRFGFQGPCVSNNMACASSAYSIIEGLKFPRFHFLTVQFDPPKRIRSCLSWRH